MGVGRAPVVLLLLLLPAGGSAQVSVVAGGAGAVPLGDFADVADVGFQGVLGASVELGNGAVVGAQAFYGRNGHRVDGERSDLYGLAVLAGYRWHADGGVALTPWIGLGGMAHAHKSEPYPGLEASRGGLSVHGGATVSKAVRRLRVFGSVFYTRGLGRLGTTFPTELVSLGAGIEVPLRLG